MGKKCHKKDCRREFKAVFGHRCSVFNYVGSVVAPGQAGHGQPLFLLLADLFVALLAVQGIIEARELLHRDQEVAEGRLELGPLAARVEQLQHEGFHLHAVEVRVHLQQVRHHEVLHKHLVALVLVRLLLQI